MPTHAQIETISLALHARIAEKLASEPWMLEHARENLERWSASGVLHPFYADQWRTLLAGPLPLLQAALVDPSEAGRALRQASIFAGCVSPRERWLVRAEILAQGAP